MSAGLAGRRVVVVGASEGIGRAFAEHAIRDGATVVMAARRLDVLEDVVKRAGGGHAVAADVTDDDSLDELAARCGDILQSIDLVVYAAGSATLRHLAESDRDMWMQTFAVNVVGFNQLARRIGGSMAAGGIIAALSSETAGVPRDGLVAYAASKAALEVSIKGWHAERPAVRWSCVAVGATFPTAFGASFEPDVIGQMMDMWVKRGLLNHEFMVPDEVAAHLAAIYASALELPSLNVEHILLRSPSPTLGTGTVAT